MRITLLDLPIGNRHRPSVALGQLTSDLQNTFGDAEVPIPHAVVATATRHRRAGRTANHRSGSTVLGRMWPWLRPWLRYRQQP